MAAVAGVTGSSRSAACCAVLLAAVLFFSAPATTEAYDSLDPNGNITIKWDIISWTPDGYVATVTMTNYQQFRSISAPGWRLGWSWAKKEVIWAMVGARATKRGDCSKFRRSRPHCCKRDPTIVDLPPGTPFNQQVANCCKAGVIKTFKQDPGNAASSFQITVGLAGTTNRTVTVPKKITLKAPGPGYTCGMWACSYCRAYQLLFLGRAQGNPSFHVMECNLHILPISCSEDSDLRLINPHRTIGRQQFSSSGRLEVYQFTRSIS